MNKIIPSTPSLDLLPSGNNAPAWATTLCATLARGHSLVRVLSTGIGSSLDFHFIFALNFYLGPFAFFVFTSADVIYDWWSFPLIAVMKCGGGNVAWSRSQRVLGMHTSTYILRKIDRQAGRQFPKEVPELPREKTHTLTHTHAHCCFILAENGAAPAKSPKKKSPIIIFCFLFYFILFYCFFGPYAFLFFFLFKRQKGEGESHRVKNSQPSAFRLLLVGCSGKF